MCREMGMAKRGTASAVDARTATIRRNGRSDSFTFQDGHIRGADASMGASGRGFVYNRGPATVEPCAVGAESDACAIWS